GIDVNLRARLPIWCVCRPEAARRDRYAKLNQFLLEIPHHGGRRLDGSLRREIVVRSSLISNGAGCYHEAGNGQVWPDSSGGGQTDDQSGAGGGELLRHEH